MEAVYAARASSREQTKVSLAPIKLRKNEHGRATHEDTETWIGLVEMTLGEVANAHDPPNGMRGVLKKSTEDAMAGIKTSSILTRDDVIKQSAADAKAKNTKKEDGRDDWAPVFSEKDTDAAQAEANRLSEANQAVIGAKEATRDAIVDAFGTTATDPVLKLPGTDTPKGLDAFELHELLAAIRLDAEAPPAGDVLTQLLQVLGFGFDFRQRVEHNVLSLNIKATRLGTNGVTFDDSHRALVIMANIEAAAKTPWGEDFKPRITAIRANFPHGYAHDATSVAAIIKELKIADTTRDMHRAPAPDSTAAKEFANSVNERRSFLTELAQSVATAGMDDSSSEDGTAAAARSNSDEEATKRGRRKAKKATKDRRRARDPSEKRSRSQARTDKLVRKNPCKYCRKHKRAQQHPNIPQRKCYWNKRLDVYRPPWVCNKMKIDYVPEEDFVSESETSGDESTEEE